jgi:hypothetical protein
MLSPPCSIACASLHVIKGVNYLELIKVLRGNSNTLSFVDVDAPKIVPRHVNSPLDLAPAFDGIARSGHKERAK